MLSIHTNYSGDAMTSRRTPCTLRAYLGDYTNSPPREETGYGVRVRPLATSGREVRDDAHRDHSVNFAPRDSTVSLVAYYTVEIQG